MINRILIKTIFLKLPFGLGSKIVNLMSKFGSVFFTYHTTINNLKRREIAKLEANKVLHSIQSTSKQAIIVYDNLSSPPTYGDFLYLIILGRYFIVNKIFVQFYIIDYEYREDWRVKSEDQISEFVSEQINLAEYLLDSSFSKIKKVSWKIFDSEIKNLLDKNIVPFSGNIQSRIAIYDHCFNLLNQLLNKTNGNLVDKILFSYKELAPKVKITLPINPYISWVCRYSEKWDFKRNLSDDEFIQIHKYLTKCFPGFSILVVSDNIGCSYFAKLAFQYNLDCMFSKNHSNTFLGDAALILKSNFFFQVRGGGIGVFPIFSKINYIITGQIIHEVMWSRNKLTTWQTDRQIYQNNALFDLN